MTRKLRIIAQCRQGVVLRAEFHLRESAMHCGVAVPADVDTPLQFQPIVETAKARATVQLSRNEVVKREACHAVAERTGALARPALPSAVPLHRVIAVH